MCDYCHLHVHSSRSFYDGLTPVEDLVRRAAELGQPGIACTDHGNAFAAPSLFKACEEHGIKGLIGMEAYEAVPHTFDMERHGPIFKVKWDDLDGRDRYYHLTLWVMNLTGWENLCALHSRSFTSEYFPTQRGKPLLDRASLERHSEGLMLGMGCVASRTNVVLGRHDEDDAFVAAKWYAEVFEDRCYMEVMANTEDQQRLLTSQRRLAKRLGVPVVATNDVHYLTQEDGELNGTHHILVQGRRYKKKDTGDEGSSTDMSDASFGRWYGSDGFYLKSGEEMLATGGLMRDEVERTCEVMGRVDFDFKSSQSPKPPKALIPEPGDDPGFDAFCRVAA